MTTNQANFVMQGWPTARHFRRRPSNGRLTVVSSAGEVRGWCTDVSEGGVGAVCAAEFTLGTEVKIAFELPGVPATIEAEAVVRYANGFQYGFEVTQISPEQRAALTAYCNDASSL